MKSMKLFRIVRLEREFWERIFFSQYGCNGWRFVEFTKHIWWLTIKPRPEIFNISFGTLKPQHRIINFARYNLIVIE